LQTALNLIPKENKIRNNTYSPKHKMSVAEFYSFWLHIHRDEIWINNKNINIPKLHAETLG
jgi:hypothetical protein